MAHGKMRWVSSCGLLALALTGCGPSPAEAEAGAATICVLPFSDQRWAEPMSRLPRPGPHSEYAFKVENLPVARIRTGAPGISIANVPASRRVKVAVSLDGWPTETLVLDLGREGRNSLCLELAHGYANWRVVATGSPRCACRGPGR